MITSERTVTQVDAALGTGGVSRMAVLAGGVSGLCQRAVTGLRPEATKIGQMAKPRRLRMA